MRSPYVELDTAKDDPDLLQDTVSSLLRENDPTGAIRKEVRQWEEDHPKEAAAIGRGPGRREPIRA